MSNEKHRKALKKKIHGHEKASAMSPGELHLAVEYALSLSDVEDHDMLADTAVELAHAGHLIPPDDHDED